MGDGIDESLTAVETVDTSIAMSAPRLVSSVDSKAAPASVSAKPVAASDADAKDEDSKLKTTSKETAQT